jgi:hypothetical protein
MELSEQPLAVKNVVQFGLYVVYCCLYDGCSVFVKRGMLLTVHVQVDLAKRRREDRLISRRARQMPFSTAGALRGKLAFGGHISIPTVIRRLYHQEMRARRPIKRPQLTLRHRHAQFDWSHDHLRGVVLRGLPARGRSVTFPVWRKRCIRRTMMEWLTLKWSATLLWLKPPLCMLTACHLSGMVEFRRTIPNQ